MTDMEYAKFIVEDTAVQLLKAASIYAVALVAYWTLV
jgi:hypothetical protein